MPAFYTHYTFVRNNTNQKDKYASICALGGQGPDVFFFYGYSLAKREKKSQTRYFGTFLHHSDISDAYNYMINYAKKQKDKKMLFAYLKGLFMHYVLDKNCHPYVFYRTGFNLNGEKNPKYRINHCLFESIIDKIYSKENGTYKNPKKCAKCDTVYVKSISKMFYHLAKYLKYSDIDEETFYVSYKDMMFAESVMYSPLGIKKFFIHNVFCRNTFVDSMVIPHSVKKYEKYDVLNLKHNVWLDCVDGGERNESFIELIAKAKAEIPIIDTVLANAEKNIDVKDEIKKNVNNIDHDGFIVDRWKKHYCNFLDPKDCN